MELKIRYLSHFVLTLRITVYIEVENDELRSSEMSYHVSPKKYPVILKTRNGGQTR